MGVVVVVVVGIYILTRGWQQMMGRVLSTIGNIRTLLLRTKLCLTLASKAETYPSNGGGVFSAISSSKRMSVASSDTRRVMPVISTSEWIWGGDGSRGKFLPVLLRCWVFNQ